MTTDKDRNNDRFKSWKLCGLWKLPFRHHGAIKFTQNCVCLSNPCMNSFGPTSFIREYHPKVLERLHLLQCISAHLQNTLPWVCNISTFLVLIVVPAYSHAAENRSKCVLKTLLRRSTHAVPIRPQKANGSSCSSQQWYPRRCVCDCLSNSNRPGLFIFFGRGPHTLLHNSRTFCVMWFFGICYILPNQHIFRKYIIFFIIGKVCFAAGWNGFAGWILVRGP